MKRKWVLCLSNEGDVNELAEKLVEISHEKKQDGLIFLGIQGHEKLLKTLSGDDSLFFTTKYPMFMPTSYITDIGLRLDSNIIFYKENVTSVTSSYELHDIFAAMQ